MRTLLLAAIFLAAPPAHAAAPTFERDVLPILKANCLSCHGGLHQRNGLDLRTPETIRGGGKSGPAAAPGKPEDTLLWKMISTDAMPKTDVKLGPDDKKVILAWLAAGMPAAAPRPAPAASKPRAPAAVAADLDRLLAAEQARAGVTAAPADDAAFLRRAHLDLTGRLPPADLARTFPGSKDPDKRAKLIDALLADPAHGRHFAFDWHNRLLPPVEGRRVYNDEFLAWLAAGFNAGRGWDQTVAALLTAEGPTATNPKSKAPANPPAAFAAAHPDPDKVAQKVGTLFLGVNLECAECHNHPFTRWRQKEDFWGAAAFFSRVKVSGAGPAPKTVTESAAPPKGNGKAPTGAALVIPSTAFTAAGQVAPANFPGGDKAKLDAVPYRPALAAWATAPDNRYFALAAANRWWAHFFARGLVTPLDDVNAGNLDAHPEALHVLADEFRASGFDPKHLARCITLTQAYGRTSRAGADKEAEELHFARMPLKTLSPEVLYDALTQALGVKDLDTPEPPAKSTLKNPPPSGRVVFVNRFDQSEEEPPTPAAYGHGVLQVLQLLNSPDLNGGGKTAERLAAATLTPAEVVEELFLITLARRPTADEARKMAAYLERQPDRRRGAAAVLWALLNTSEFVFNH